MENGSEDSDLWDYRRVLYAYFAVDDKEILYIGKAGRQTVRERRTRSAKKSFWHDLEKERNIHETIVRVGEIRLEEGRKISRELLLDAESLLIKRLGPWGNIRSRSSRISRPGLRVRCEGDWPLASASSTTWVSGKSRSIARLIDRRPLPMTTNPRLGKTQTGFA